jgi:hypothetical protein
MPAVIRRGGCGEKEGKEAVLFLKKKNQKNFCPFPGDDAEAPASPPDGTKWRKSFFASFCSQKEESSFP